MTQYISDLLRKIQTQLKELSDTIEQIIAPEDGDYVYVDKTRGGLDEHTTEIPPDDNSN